MAKETELGIWLEQIGLGKYADLFKQQAIDLDVIGELGEADLVELGLPMGHRKKLLRA
ncbi:MAG: SAM domain-containing protein, partial [Geminicoccaceae bacterium]